MNINDADRLLGMAKNGDGDAFCELAKGFDRDIRRELSLVLKWRAGSLDEEVQDVLIRAWKYIGSCWAGHFRGWIKVIARNQAKQVACRKFPKEMSASYNLLRCIVQPRGTPVWELMDQRDRARDVRHTVSLLKREHQRAINSEFWLGESIRKQAERTGASFRKCRRNRHEAKEEFRKWYILSIANGLAGSLF